MSSDCIAHKKGFQPVEAFLTCQSDSFMSMKHIGKSERTVKSMTVNLSERGIIERKNGRRNGFWEIKK